MTTSTSAMKKLLLTFTLILVSSQVFAIPTLLHNVNGYSINQGKLVQFDAILFEDDKIIAIGSKDNLSKRAKISRPIDGQGKTLLPGLADAHGHILSLGLNLSRVDLRDLNSLEATLLKVKDFAKQNPTSRWLLGQGWNQVLWPSKQFPNKINLDSVVADRPVFLRRIDGHAAWANSAALKIAGIDQNTADPAGGKIIRDEQGQATGILIDKAQALVSQHIPKINQQERENALELAFEQLLSEGITSVHDAGISFDNYQTYLELSLENKLPIRVYAMFAGSDKNLLKVLEHGKVEQDFLKVRSVKLMLDGALGSRGAALLAPYSDDKDNLGLLFASAQETSTDIKTVADAGFQANIHAIGDKANQVVLDAIADLSKSERSKNVGGEALRHRIEHAQVIALEDIPRLHKLNVIASIQPTHATSDMNMAEDRVGAERIKGAYAWRELLNNKVRIAAGSDFPVELSNPFFGIHAAATRQSRDNQPSGGWRADQKLNLSETLKAFTIDAAFAAHWENQIGSLEADKQADFILVDKDIFQIKAEELWQTQVLETWVAGQKVYVRKDL